VKVQRIELAKYVVNVYYWSVHGSGCKCQTSPVVGLYTISMASFV
jgi:hypothetical protein